jgi:hypothetical protein
MKEKVAKKVAELRASGKSPQEIRAAIQEFRAKAAEKLQKEWAEVGKKGEKRDAPEAPKAKGPEGKGPRPEGRAQEGRGAEIRNRRGPMGPGRQGYGPGVGPGFGPWGRQAPTATDGSSTVGSSPII